MSFYGNLLARLAYWNHLRGHIEAAERIYARAYARGMNSPVPLGTYGVLLLRKGEYEDALMLFNQALADKNIKPALRVNIRMNRSLAYFKLGQVDKAIAALEDIHRKHKSARVYQSLGYVYIMAGQYEKAMAYNREALEYDDEDPVILDNMGQLYYVMGDLANARKYFEEAYSHRKDQVDILYHLSLVEERDGDMEAALRYAERASECAINTLNDVTPDQVRQRCARLRELAREKAPPSPPERES